MKIALLFLFVVSSLAAFAKDKNADKNVSKEKIIKIDSKVSSNAKPAIPCDSKEDLLKKIEEKKKLENEKSKGFSLQGGNTGCSVK
jgi:hypothetical protein